MPIWIVYALIATLFAGVSAVLVKFSIRDISAELGMVVRIGIVFVIVLINLFLVKGYKESVPMNNKGFFYLIVSGITTAICWIFYYKAIDIGNVSTISAIDRGSIVVTILLAAVFLGEPLTLKLALGAGFILMGMLVLIWK